VGNELEVVAGRDLDHPNQVGVHALQPVTRQRAQIGGHSTLPHDAGDDAHAGGGWSGGWRAAHQRRQLVQWAQEAERIGVPRRTMAGVQDEAKHAMSAMSPLKSCEVEKPQPQR
jgi:hypothetical protein